MAFGIPIEWRVAFLASQSFEGPPACRPFNVSIPKALGPWTSLALIFKIQLLRHYNSSVI